MDILRSATSGWTGTLTGGGATRVFKFNAVTPRVIDSWMDAFGGGMTVQRGMKLTLLNGTENQPVDCIFDSASQDFSRENAAAEGFMALRGLIPPSPDFVPHDFFRASQVEGGTQTEVSKGNTLHIRFLLGHNNVILPTARAGTRFRAVCTADEGTLDPPRRMLDFKIVEYDNPDSLSVFARIIDIETGKIIAQRESHVAGADADALTLAMQESAAQIAADGSTFGPLSDGVSR